MSSLIPNFVVALVSVTVWGVGLSGIVGAAAPQRERVELFAAVADQLIDLRVVPKDATQATVIVKNKTNRPLSIQMPAAFVGMPVLAQNVGNNRGGGGGGNNNSSNTANQSFGGGMGGMMGGMGGMMGGGFFDVGPDRVGKIKVATVCLEHGKEDPNPRVAYELKPITEFTDKIELAEVCRMLGDGRLDQPSAQAAAWHLSDGLSFQELATKVRVQHLNGQVEMYFQPQQLQAALRAVHVAHRRAAEIQAAAESTSPGEQADAAARPVPLSLK
jgi:hypothetical protein